MCQNIIKFWILRFTFAKLSAAAGCVMYNFCLLPIANICSEKIDLSSTEKEHENFLWAQKLFKLKFDRFCAKPYVLLLLLQVLGNFKH